VLSEKTIEQHLGGIYLPTRIKVTRAAASHKRQRPERVSVSNPSSDLSSDSDSGWSGGSGPESIQTEAFEIQVGKIELEQPCIEPDTVNQSTVIDNPQIISDAEEGDFEQVVQDTWSGCHSRVDDYESNTEVEDFDKDKDSDSDVDSEFDWGERGMRNGLEMDDLIDEDFQHIIAEFGVLTFPYCFSGRCKPNTTTI
jgi:hypothetical protein